MKPLVSVVDISFPGGFKDALATAPGLGFDHVQTRNVATPLGVDLLETPDRIRGLLEEAEAVGLAISSTSGGYGSLFDGKDLTARIDNEIRLAELTVAFGCRILTGHIGAIPADGSWKVDRTLRRELDRWLEALDRLGVSFAVETGPEHGEVLADFFETLGSKRMWANLDPANFAIFGFDVSASCRALYDRTIHMHVKDASGTESALTEAAVGDGVVPLEEILAEVLASAPVEVIAVEREEGDTRVPDIARARDLIAAALTGTSAS